MAWASFQANDVVTVQPAAAPVTQMVLVNRATGSQFDRPVGGTGNSDSSATPGESGSGPRTSQPAVPRRPVLRPLAGRRGCRRQELRDHRNAILQGLGRVLNLLRRTPAPGHRDRRIRVKLGVDRSVALRPVGRRRVRVCRGAAPGVSGAGIGAW
ncbi:hypothetical protein ACIHEI_17180 [Kitasatospora sp. NPDC051984]|uniref:hypothetical protein n=1 Tax=Kitasatospora sp. NPDC051984 TaxID=3364059 RepID=UPI0037C8755E